MLIAAQMFFENGLALSLPLPKGEARRGYSNSFSAATTR